MKTVISLSLDGGGFQSLSQLFILMEIMQRLEWILKLEASPLPCEHFDFMGGSGSGGIIALLLGRFRLQIEVAIECFIHVYQTISSSSLDKASRSKCLEDVIKSLVQEHLPGETSSAKLRRIDPKCKTFICAMPSLTLTGPKPVRLFRNFRPRKHASFDCTIWEAARATTAHPRLFVPIRIGPTWARETFIEPCLRYNNPVELVIEETNSVYPQSTAEVCFVSLGAGHPGISGVLANEDDWSSVLHDIAKDCEGIADQVARRYQTGYFRLNVFQGLQGIVSEPLLDSGQIASHTQQYLRDSFIDGRVDEIVQLLVKRYQERASPASFTTIIDPKIEQLVASMPLVNFWDLELDQEILTCQNYTFCQGRVRSERFLVQTFCGSSALKERDQTLRANIQAFHPGVIRAFRKSDDYCPDPFLVYPDDDIAPADFQMSRALELSDTAELVRLGVSLIGNIASALQFLESKSQKLVPLHMTEETFIIFARSNGQYALAFTPNTAPVSSTTYKINTELLQHLCSKTVTDATIAAYPERKKETLYANQLFEQQDISQTSNVNASRFSHLDTTESAEEVIAQLRLYSWQRDVWEDVTLKEVSAEFAPFCSRMKKTSLRRIVNGDIPREITGCPGYRRDEIRLSLRISSSAIIIHNFPDVLETCAACGKQHTRETYMDTYQNTEDDDLSSIFQDLEVHTTIPDILVETFAGSLDPNTPLDIDFNPDESFPQINTFKSSAPNSPILTHNPMSPLATYTNQVQDFAYPEQDDSIHIQVHGPDGGAESLNVLDYQYNNGPHASLHSETGMSSSDWTGSDYAGSPNPNTPLDLDFNPDESFPQINTFKSSAPSSPFLTHNPRSPFATSMSGLHFLDDTPPVIPDFNKNGFSHTRSLGTAKHRTVSGPSIHQHSHSHSLGSLPSSSYSRSPMHSPLQHFSPLSSTGPSPDQNSILLPPIVYPSLIQQQPTQHPEVKKTTVGSAAIESVVQNRRTEGRVIKHKCEICERGFTTKHNLTNHVNSHHGTLRYTCDLCTRQFTTKVVMERHKKKCKGGHISSA